MDQNLKVTSVLCVASIERDKYLFKTFFQRHVEHMDMFLFTRTIVVNFRHRFTIININDTPVPVGLENIHLIHLCLTVNL